MKALVYRRSVVRYLACQFLSRVWRRRFFPKAAPLSLDEVPFSPPEGWVRLKVLMCGICGSDLGLLRGAESYLMEPYASLPAILGHEMVAEVLDAPGETGFRAGERVVVEPMLPCEVRGLQPCRFCAQGNYNLCENFLQGELPPGMVLGYNSTAGGGMAEYSAAHPSRLRRVPDSLSTRRAVLVDALASALQPALDNFPQDDDVVVVFGAGIIGQNLVRCMRGLGSKARIIVVARHGFQRDMAIAGGADTVLMSPDRKALGQAVGARLVPTTLGGGTLEGGATHFFDCVGSARSMQEGFLCLRARGTYVMVATAGKLSGVDFSSVWHRELRIRGGNCYAKAEFQGKTVNTYDVALDLLASGKLTERQLDGLLTHVFPLEDWQQAFHAAFDKRGTKSMKVALAPHGETALEGGDV